MIGLTLVGGTDVDDAGESRPLPMDLDAEAAVISAMLLDPDRAVPVVRSVLRPEHCFAEAHRRILEAAMAVSDSGMKVDIVSVGAHLKGSDRLGQVGGMAYLTEILAAAPVVTNVRTYAEIVFERWRCRQVIVTSERIAGIGYVDRPNDVQAYVDDAIAKLTALSRMQPGKVRRTNADVLTGMMRSMTGAAAPGAKKVGIPTGFVGLDAVLGGLHSGHKITIAALSGCGKTTMGLQIAAHVARLGIGVLFFSAEQDHEECVRKILSASISVPYADIQKGTLSPKGWSDLASESVRFAELPLWIETRDTMSVSDIEASSLRQAEMTGGATPPLGLIIVDHLHKLAAPPGLETSKTFEQVDANSVALKALAKKLRIPLIELAQQKAMPKGERPGDSSIFYSTGKVRQESDVIVYLHRENPKTAPSSVTAIVHKNRFGGKGDVELYMEGAYSRFRAYGSGDHTTETGD